MAFLKGKPLEISPQLGRLDDFDDLHIEIYLNPQMLHLTDGQQVFLSSSISSGRQADSTPQGTFTVGGRQESYASPDHGRYIDREGNLLLAQVNLRTDPAPAGGRFEAVPIRHLIRLNDGGPHLFAGKVRGYPSTDGAILLPEETARRLFEIAYEGMEVRILAAPPEDRHPPE